VYLTLDDYRAAHDEELAEVNSSEKDPDHLARRRNDLRDMRKYIDYTKEALKKRHWKRAVLCGIVLGIASHKALYARKNEPDVLHLRESRKKGGGAAAAKRNAKRKLADAADGPEYRKRMLELRNAGTKYEQASFIVEMEFRKKPRDRHHAARIRELVPDPIPRKDSTPPRDYVR